MNMDNIIIIYEFTTVCLWTTYASMYNIVILKSIIMLIIVPAVLLRPTYTST